jgi:hypothetical protein
VQTYEGMVTKISEKRPNHGIVIASKPDINQALQPIKKINVLTISHKETYCD